MSRVCVNMPPSSPSRNFRYAPPEGESRALFQVLRSAEEEGAVSTQNRQGAVVPVSEETDPKVVVNGKVLRSIRLANRVNKPGWPDEATPAARTACLDYTGRAPAQRTESGGDRRRGGMVIDRRRPRSTNWPLQPGERPAPPTPDIVHHCTDPGAPLPGPWQSTVTLGRAASPPGLSTTAVERCPLFARSGGLEAGR